MARVGRVRNVILAFLLMITGAALSVAQAGAQDGTPAVVTDTEGEITFWHGYAAGGGEAATLDNLIMPAAQEAFPNVDFEVLQVPFDQLQNKYNTEASAGGGPDILLGPSDWIGGYVEADVIRSLDDLAPEGFADEYSPASISAMTLNDSLYGVPQSNGGVALWYNTSLVSEPPATTDDLLALSAQIYEESGGQTYGLVIFPQFYNLAGYLYGFGATALNEDGTSGFDSPETVEFLTFIQTLSQAPGILVVDDEAGSQSAFQEGRAAMVISGPWFTSNAVTAFGEEGVGVAKLPAISPLENAPARPFIGTTGLYINANLDDEEAELAFQFAQWYSTVGTEFLVTEAGQIPASTQVEIPADQPFAAAFVEQFQEGVAQPTVPEMANVWEAADDMINKVIRGEATPEQAAADAASTINTANGF